MLKNYFKTALRNARRGPLNTIINVLGLSVGIGCCLVIGLYVQDELSFDRFHENADQLYRLEQTIQDGTLRWEVVNVDHGPALKEHVPQVEETARLFIRGFLTGSGDTHLADVRIAFADPSVLSMFSFETLAGEPASMLDEPGDIVLRRGLSDRLFGDVNPIGQTVLLDNEHAFTVSGVVDLPQNTSLDNFEAMVPFDIVYDHYSWLRNNAGASTTFTYVQLAENADQAAAVAGLPRVSEAVRGDASSETLHLKRLTELRLDPETTDTTGTRGTVMLLTAIALLVLIIACVNYVNLATAAGVGRLREVGMRKAFGAHRKQLITQFIGESSLLVGLAVVIAFLLTEGALPFVNDLTGKALSLGILNSAFGVGMLVALCLLVGLAAGAYPALYVTRLKPVQILKGRQGLGAGTPILRRALIVVQFTASITLISGALAIQQQLEFMSQTDLGFSGDQVLTIPVQTGDESAVRAFKASIERESAVTSVSRFSGNLGQHGWRAGMNALEGDAESLNHLFFPADSRFLDTMELALVAGRNFVAEAESEELIVNETSVRALGYENPEDILGKRYSVNYVSDGEVVGVVGDFHLNSLRDDIGPLVFAHQESGMYMMAVKLASGSVVQSIDTIENVWNATIPDWPFSFQFVDDTFDALYRAEQREGTLFSWFAGLAVLVACLGLFGLVSLTARQRTKEVGIRKVLGASAFSILSLLSRSFVAQVVVAFAIAAPLTWIFMTRWLSGFAYHIDFPVATLIGGGVVTLGITILVVGLRSVRAANADPVDALRYE